MRKSVWFYLLMLNASIIFSQETKKEVEKEKTKMESFASKTGAILKFVDVNLKVIKPLYGGQVETRIRKVISGSVNGYFFQIEKSGQYSNSTASIDYSDLIEVVKAMKSLKSEVDSDLQLKPDYLENKFTTVDGFQIGYYIAKGKINWYIRLEKSGSDNTIFINDVNVIEESFLEAKNKIEELKKVN